jgi:hypothetical protein
MRAERVVTTSFECAPGTSPSRRLTRSSACRFSCRLLMLLAGALALFALWGPAPRGDAAGASRARTEVSQPNLPAERPAGETLTPGQSVEPIAEDLDSLSFDEPTVDAALLAAAVLPSLTLLYWLFVILVGQLRPGITSALFVPG